jgi:hypothetical protein
MIKESDLYLARDRCGVGLKTADSMKATVKAAPRANLFSGAKDPRQTAKKSGKKYY